MDHSFRQKYEVSLKGYNLGAECMFYSLCFFLVFWRCKELNNLNPQNQYGTTKWLFYPWCWRALADFALLIWRVRQLHQFAFKLPASLRPVMSQWKALEFLDSSSVCQMTSLWNPLHGKLESLCAEILSHTHTKMKYKLSTYIFNDIKKHC